MTSTITPAKQRVQKAASFLLALYSFLFFLMHFIRIFDNSFWGDEGFTIRLAKMGFVDMVSATAKDVHPPLYYFFTQILCHIFGFHGYTYHLTAVIPYGLILVLCCTVVRKWFGVLPAAVVVTLSSLTDAALIYNVEARMYSLAALFVFTAYLAFYQIYQKNRLVDWFIFGFASLCAAYTHYYALISVAFFYLMLLPLLRRGKEYTKRILLLYGLTVLSYIFWLYVLLKTFKRTNGNWWLQSIATFSDCFDFIWGYKWLAIAAFVLFALAVVQFLRQFQQQHSFSAEAIFFFAGLISIFGTIFFGISVSYVFSPFIVPRYLFPLAPVAYLMLGLLFPKFDRTKILALLFFCEIFALGFPAYRELYQHEQDVERGTQICTEYITSSGDPIIYANDNGWSFPFVVETLFPNVPYVNDSNALDSLDDSHKDIWIFWSSELNNAQKEQLARSGFTAEEVYSGCAYHDFFSGKFVTNPVKAVFHLYRVQKTEALS